MSGGGAASSGTGPGPLGQLVASLIAFAAEHRPDGADGELRITSGSRVQPSWSALSWFWDNFDNALAEAARGANSLLQSMEGLPPGALPGGEEITLEVGDWLATQAELRHRLTGFAAQPGRVDDLLAGPGVAGC